MLGLDQFDTVLAFTGIMLLLSVVVTALVQIIATILNLRGWVLRHGIKQILLKVAPGTNASYALKIAELILKDPSITHQFIGRTAVAIRKSELVLLLQDLLKRWNPITDPDSKAIIEFLSFTGAMTAHQREAIQNTDAQAEEAKANAARSVVEAAFTDGAALKKNIDTWFDTVIDRTSELFTAWSHGITVALAALVTFGCQIDAAQIYNNLSTNKALRDTWVQQSQRILDNASRILPQLGQEGSKGSKDAGPSEIKAAILRVEEKVKDPENKKRLSNAPQFDSVAKAEEWIKQGKWNDGAEKDKENSGLVLKLFLDELSKGNAPAKPEVVPLATAALREIATKVKDDANKAKLLSAPQLQTQADGERWIGQGERNWAGGPETTEQIRTWFQNAYAELSVKRIEDLLKVIDNARSSLAAENVQLIGNPKWTALGTIMAWLLLSLGAPFWFNLLRTLSNLRPALAGKVESQQKP